MGYIQVRYNSRVVNYDCRGFIRLAADTIGNLLLQCWLMHNFHRQNLEKKALPSPSGIVSIGLKFLQLAILGLFFFIFVLYLQLTVNKSSL